MDCCLTRLLSYQKADSKTAESVLERQSESMNTPM